MRLFNTTLLATTTIITALVPCTAMAEDLPLHEVKPIVLLLLDTSGSMEYDVNSLAAEIGNNDDFLDPPGCPAVDGTWGKSRFIVAQEVLTGTFDNYTCEKQERNNVAVSPCPREDCPYVVPHIVALGDQRLDGLIDRSIESFKFGVMTFDTKESPDTGESGGYSYGPEETKNYGARNEGALTGKFVHPWASDVASEVRAQNELVQASILSAIPYGGTPISPQLFDAKYFFENDPDILSDAYLKCRTKTVILVTDGRANLAPSPPYISARLQAKELRDIGVNLYVIGFKLNASVSSEAWDIATDGGNISGTYFEANSGTDLVRAFTQILGNLDVATQSRTRTVVTNETGNGIDVQYQFNAVHAKVRDQTGLGWIPFLRQGILRRLVYQCGQDENLPDQSSLSVIQVMSDLLNQRPDGNREVKTVIEGLLNQFDVGNPDLTALMLGAPSAGNLIPDFSRDASTGFCSTDFLPITNTREQNLADFRRNLIEYVLADTDSCRRGYRTGAIDHGTPAVQGRLQGTDLQIPSFRSYKASIALRPVMLYAPTHDGLLHAFKVDRPNGNIVDQDWGREEWAFVPPHTLPRLAELPNGIRTLLDGTPVVKDVVLSRAQAGVDGETGSAWRSVLLIGDRDGGRGMAALDVTDPTTSNWQFMWDISAEAGRCVQGEVACNPDNDSHPERNDFSMLGRTWGRPEIGSVQVCPDETTSCVPRETKLRELAVAVIPGGNGSGLGSDAGKSVFVVRMDTGARLAEFKSGNANVFNNCSVSDHQIDADMVGSVACFSTFPGTFMSRCFMGDAAGRLWRLELGSEITSAWTLTMFYDPYKSLSPVPTLSSPIRAPVYEAPALAIQSLTNSLVVVYGSGEMDSLDCSESSTLQRNFVVSLAETIEPYTGRPGAACSPWSDQACRMAYTAASTDPDAAPSQPTWQVGPTLLWKKFLGFMGNMQPEHDPELPELPDLECERMMGQPVIFSSVAYFTTFTPNPETSCSAGIGRLYGAAFDSHRDNCSQMVPKLNSSQDPTKMVVTELIGTTTSGSIPYGLSVVTRPACSSGEAISGSTNPSGGSGAPFALAALAVPQLVVQTGVKAEDPKEIPTHGSPADPINMASRTIRRAVESIFVSSWGNLLD